MTEEAILLIYIAATIVIGAKTKATSLKKFILGDRLGTLVMTATIVSTFYGASAILGGVSLTYQLGLGVIWFMIPFYLGNVATIFLIKKIALPEKYTLPDFLGSFYNKEFAIASSVLLATLCLVPEEIIAGGKILAAFTAIPTQIAMCIVAFVLITPIVIGGMKADVMTDVIQIGLMFFMVALIAPFSLATLPPQPIFNLPEGYLNPLAYISGQEIAVFCILLFFLPITSAPLYQRLFASKSEMSSKKAVLYSIVIWIIIDVVIILSGFAAFWSFPDLSDPDMALISLGTALPAIGRSIFFVGLLAAIMSTVNSFLQSGASSLAYDVFRQLRPTTGDGQLLMLARLFVIALGLLSLSLALWFQMIVPALLFTLTMWTSGILVPVLSALLGQKLRKDSALYCLIGGASASLIWKFIQPLDIDALFIGLLCSALVAIISEFFYAFKGASQ